jgi:uncharacterized membrane protein (Fun14 family)
MEFSSILIIVLSTALAFAIGFGAGIRYQRRH